MPICKLEYGELYFEDHGTGLPIIFLHPPGMGRKVFHFQQVLSKEFRVVFPDLSGHGDSNAISATVKIQNYANEIFKLIDHLGLEKVIVCGYSSGGSIAQEFALAYPERTEAVILSGGFAKVESLSLKYEHLLGMYFVKHFPKTLAKVIATAHTFDKDYRNELIQHMMKADLRTWFQFYSESLNYSCLGRLKTIKAPMLLIYGANDFINQHIRAYQREANNYKTAIIQKVAHQVPVKKWQEFNLEIMNFVNGLQTKPQ